MSKRHLVVILLPIGVLAIALFVLIGFNLLDLSTKVSVGDLLNIVVLVILVLVTSFYAVQTLEIAKATREQADASVKMAEEMREQRYDAVRPVIDIERHPTELERASVVLNTDGKQERFPDKLTCILRNIGIGPATDVYSFTPTVGGERRRQDFGTLPINGESGREIPLLSPEQRGDRWFLVAYYRDLYGRCFESSREVNRSDWKLGPLDTCKIAKEELPK